MTWLLLFVLSAAASPFTDCIDRAELSGPCVWLYLSKVLGYFLVVISFGLKFPQISTILRTKSVEGLSAVSFYVEVYSFGLMAMYCLHQGQPLNTFADNIILGIQCVVQVLLLWTYGNFSRIHKVIMVSQFFLIFSYLLSDSVPDFLWSLIIVSNLPINTVVKGSQMLKNYKNQSTGQLSLGTIGMSLMGCVIRVLTSAVETNDLQLLFNYVIGTGYNAVLVAQIFYYRQKQKTG